MQFKLFLFLFLIFDELFATNDLQNARPHQEGQQSPSQQNDYQKSDETKEYTIEVLVGVDKKMQEYHGKNLKDYVLTLMSDVSVLILF
jgi:hypothetical protein